MPEYTTATIALPLTDEERRHNRTATGEDRIPQRYIRRGVELDDDATARLDQPITLNGEPQEVTHLQMMRENGVVTTDPPEPAEDKAAPADGTEHVAGGDTGDVQDRQGT